MAAAGDVGKLVGLDPADEGWLELLPAPVIGATDDSGDGDGASTGVSCPGAVHAQSVHMPSIQYVSTASPGETTGRLEHSPDRDEHSNHSAARPAPHHSASFRIISSICATFPGFYHTHKAVTYHERTVM